MNNQLVIFGLLQLADILSTLVFLSMGIQEGNPLVRFFVQWMSPIFGLILVKLIGIGVGMYWFHRGHGLKIVNIGFSVLILWNLLAIYGTPRALIHHI